MDKYPAGIYFQTSIRRFFQLNQSKAPTATVTSTPGSSSEIRLGSIDDISRRTKSNLPINLEISGENDTHSYLPRQAAITQIVQSHIQPLQRINALLLPVSYPDSFYRSILSPDPPIVLSRGIIWSDPEPKVIGGIICCIDPIHSLTSKKEEIPQVKESSNNIYIQSLALLSPYRGKGLASHALKSVIETAIKHKELKVVSLYAHVWTNNQEALKWYSAQGFDREEPIIHGYYPRLSPDTAFIVRRRLNHSDYLKTLSPSPVDSRIESISNGLEDQSNSFRLTSDIHSSTRSFQEKGPDQEWNDLPEDLVKIPQIRCGTKQTHSSESKNKIEASGKAKKKRVYPTAAFGSLK